MQDPATRTNFSRRSFIQGGAGAILLPLLPIPTVTGAPAGNGPYQSMGTRAGEITPTSAILWTRLTTTPVRNNDGLLIPGRLTGKDRVPDASVIVPVPELEGACPGALGRIRIRYGTREDLQNAVETPWADVAAANDFIHQFRLTGLKPSTVY